MPTKEEIRKFLEVVEALNRFEMDHRGRCGWGAWTEGEQHLPFPEAVKVTAWLRNVASADTEEDLKRLWVETLAKL